MEQKENNYKVMIMKARLYLIALAELGVGINKKFTDFITEQSITDPEEEIVAVFDYMVRQKWVVDTSSSKNSIKYFHYSITDAGVEIAEKFRNKNRFWKVLEVCDAAESYSLNAMLYTLSQFEKSDLDKAILEMK